jgi:hypothetical protein
MHTPPPVTYPEYIAWMQVVQTASELGCPFDPVAEPERVAGWIANELRALKRARRVAAPPEVP